MSLPDITEYFDLFDNFASGADLTSQIGPSYTPCRAAFSSAFLGVFYTMKWAQTPAFAATPITIQMQNITSALSFSSDFVLKCTTSVEDATISFGEKYTGLETIDKLLLAFMMNLVGNVQTIYSAFTSITLASADCDYYLVSRRMGQLFKALSGFSAELLGV